LHKIILPPNYLNHFVQGFFFLFFFVLRNYACSAVVTFSARLVASSKGCALSAGTTFPGPLLHSVRSPAVDFFPLFFILQMSELIFILTAFCRINVCESARQGYYAADF